MDIRSLLKERVVIFDGAMGTMLQKRGLKTGEIPESLNFTHPEIIKEIHAEYIASGCDVITTNTFGANSYKTEKSGYSVEEIVSKAVCLAKEVCKDKYVALGIGPIGKLMEPVGDMSFDQACELYKEQIVPGLKAGVDLILFETFTDLYEMKAAAITARELTNLPIFCSITLEENGRMLMGADALTAVNTLQDLGIDAVGINCSLGPKQMIPMVEEILKYSKLPVLVQPNAGLPKVVDGETVFDVDVDEFVDSMEQMLNLGVSIVGGCCGTSPDYIKRLADRVSLIGDKIVKTKVKPFTAVSSATKTVVFDDRIRVIGERINPTGKKLLKEALKKQDYAYIEDEAIRQVNVGADVLDINVGLPEIDEEAAMLEAIKRVSSVVDVPLQIDSADPTVIEKAVRIYNGKPIINSVNGKQEVMDAIFPIVKKYGACVIALTLDERGLPKDVNERIEIAEKIINEAAKYGIGKERIIVDCLTLTVSAQQSAGKDTLEAIRQIKSRLGVKTTLGVSNVSFGLPERKLLNRTFLAMALEAGLDAPITDPLVDEYMDTIRAFETLAFKDIDSKDYIVYYGGKESPSESTPKSEHSLSEIILKGHIERAAKATEELLKTKRPMEIIEELIIPTLEIVGQDFESGAIFLPQLIQSADTVKCSFDILRKAMKSTRESISYGKVVLATVKGDIHDIGKNIVKVLLENYGYEVIDLGKDVDIELIVETARKEDVKLVGLSALMTTTVVNMEATIKALRQAGLTCKVAVGGAVLNPEYAKKINADFYCKDAMEGVRVANLVYKENTDEQTDLG
ncbi:MAG: dihydropteroate synthase [Clostridiales bacterium]|nr:dihydropteroate synthase [Clostridiales bacterium]